jgi:hypothetical protein
MGHASVASGINSKTSATDPSALLAPEVIATKGIPNRRL